MVNHFWPASLDEAMDILRTEQVTIYAGGAGLMSGPRRERSFLFLSRIQELKRFSQDDNYFRLGALLTFEQLLEKHNVPQFLQSVATAVKSPALRGQSTIGGTLVSDGPASDLAVCAMAADGEVRIIGGNGERTVPIRAFFQGRTDVDLSPRELVAELLIPKDKLEPFVFEKVDDSLSMAASASWEENRLTYFSLVFGGEGLLARPELDKGLWDRTKDEIRGELEGYVSSWSQAIATGREPEDRLALARKNLFRMFVEEQF